MDIDPLGHGGWRPSRSRNQLRLGFGRGAVPGSDGFELAFRLGLDRRAVPRGDGIELAFRRRLRFVLDQRDRRAFDRGFDDRFKRRRFGHRRDRQRLVIAGFGRRDLRAFDRRLDHCLGDLFGAFRHLLAVAVLDRAVAGAPAPATTAATATAALGIAVALAISSGLGGGRLLLFSHRLFGIFECGRGLLGAARLAAFLAATAAAATPTARPALVIAPFARPFLAGFAVARRRKFRLGFGDFLLLLVVVLDLDGRRGWRKTRLGGLAGGLGAHGRSSAPP